MFKTIGEVVRAELDGKVRNYRWRKTPSQATTAGLWYDLANSPGNPSPKFWFDATPLTAKAVYQSTDGGLYHGPNVSPSAKYLRSITTQANAATALPMNVILCDYLLYYPTIDCGTTDPQVMDNTVTLPRYTTGYGVQMVAVTAAGNAGGQTFSVTYTNSDGVAGRVSATTVMNSASQIGTVTTSATATDLSANPFIGLQSGDQGVRSIQSVTVNGADIGLFSIVLVKPMMQTIFREVTVPFEKDFLIPANDLEQIYDDAFLGFLALPNGALNATTLTGDLKVIWN